MRLRYKTLLTLALIAAVASPASSQAPPSNAAAPELESARKKEIIDGDLEGAVRLYKEISFKSGKVKFKVPELAVYEGTLGADGTSIAGSWNQELFVPLPASRVRVLAIYAFGGTDNPAQAEAQANAFEKGVPSARVVRFPRAQHFFFINSDIPLNQINRFVATLP